MSIIAYKILQKENLVSIVSRWMKAYVVIAPVKYGTATEFRVIDDPRQIYLHDGNSFKSPKGSFFPQNEILFTIKNQELQPITSSKPTILIGVKSCDVTSFAVMDKVFINHRYVDPYYKQRRDKTVVMGYACTQLDDGAFCTTLNISPTHNEDSDLFWHDVGDAYLIDVITSKGYELIQDLSDATEQYIKMAYKVQNVIKNMIPVEFDVADIPDEKTLFESDIWDEVYQRCIGCGICTYICPTCHCFEFYDERTKKDIKRYRNWDSCMFALFTEQASGYNPRPTQKERIRQRFMHKFCYYPINFGVISCVGCGRCVRQCPVNIDIRHIIKQACNYGKKVVTKSE